MITSLLPGEEYLDRFIPTLLTHTPHHSLKVHNGYLIHFESSKYRVMVEFDHRWGWWQYVLLYDETFPFNPVEESTLFLLDHALQTINDDYLPLIPSLSVTFEQIKANTQKWLYEHQYNGYVKEDGRYRFSVYQDNAFQVGIFYSDRLRKWCQQTGQMKQDLCSSLFSSFFTFA